MITRRRFLKMFGMGFVSMSLPAISLSAQTKKHNVLFISIDDLRGAMGCLDNKYVLAQNRSVDDNGKQAATECANVPDKAYIDGKVAVRAVEKIGKLVKKRSLFFWLSAFASRTCPAVRHLILEKHYNLLEGGWRATLPNRR